MDWSELNASVSGTIPFTVNTETFHTWYRVFGDLTNTSQTPLIVIHGGPGLSHDYLLPISDLNALHATPVIFYDQIGCARSTHLTSKPQSFWTIDLFIDELINVINFFGIQGNFDILGHSWGTTLAIEFVLRRQPKGLKRLIFSNGLASKKTRNEAFVQLAMKFPEDVQAGLGAGYSDPKRMGQAFLEFVKVHGCRVDPMPKEVLQTMENAFGDDGDLTVAKAMDVTLEKWDVVSELHRIKIPTLVLNGRYDYMTDVVCAPFFRHMEKVRWVTFESLSHMPMWEERQRYMEIVSGFLNM